MAWYDKSKESTKQVLKNKDLWIGFAAGLALSLVFAFGYGWCEASAWFGWTQLEVGEQWDFGLKILGGLGALGVFLWTINQWLLSKKIEFEQSILSNLENRYNFFIREREKYKKEKQPDHLISAPHLISECIRLDEEKVREQNLGFKELRTLNKKYLGTVNMNLEALRDTMLADESLSKQLKKAFPAEFDEPKDAPDVYLGGKI